MLRPKLEVADIFVERAGAPGELSEARGLRQQIGKSAAAERK
jgi:hypothetical protein